MKHALEHKLPFYKKSPIQNLYLFSMGMFFIGLISCLLNRASPVTGIFGLRYILLLALFSSFLHFFGVLNLNIKSFMRFVVYVGVIQLPFSILQRILLSTHAGGLDFVSGTFTYYFSLAFIQLLSISIVIIYWLLTGQAIIGKSVFPLFVILFIPLILSNARAVFLFLIILLCMIAIRYRKEIMLRFFNYFVYGVILILIMYLGFISVFWRSQRQSYGRDLKRQYSIDFILEYNYRPALSYYQHLESKDDPRMGRFIAIMTAFDLISDSPHTLIFGLGPGNTQESQVFGKSGKYYQKYGSLSGLSKNQLSLVLSEFGLLGILLYSLFFGRLWKLLQRIKNINMLEYQLTSGVYLVLLGLIFLFFIYSQVLNNYVVVLVLSYFIAVLQQRLFQTNN